MKMKFDQDTMGEVIHKYVTLRDKIDEVDKRHKEKTAPAREVLKFLEAELLDRLNKAEGNSFASPFGTAFRSSRKSATIADGEAFRSYVIENTAWDLVDIRANSTATADFIAEHGTVPPGVNFSETYTVNVRRPSKK
jgi:hypothetical protein